VSPTALILEEGVGSEGAGLRREVPRRVLTKARLEVALFGRAKR
jgi:hypothetical protein